MNLFIEELTEYVIEAWGKAFQAKAGQREARFVLQSLGPLETLALFERLDSHAQDHYAPTQTRCYFRTAKALWEAWDRSSENAQDAIASLEGRGRLERRLVGDRIGERRDHRLHPRYIRRSTQRAFDLMLFAHDRHGIGPVGVCSTLNVGIGQVEGT